MTYQECILTLSSISSDSFEMPTLGSVKTGNEKSKFTVTPKQNSFIISTSGGSSMEIDRSHWNRVVNRYNELEEEEKQNTGSYTDPKWKEVPNRIFSPYVAGLLVNLIRKNYHLNGKK